jgi:catechol 2,3-dioxygenase-like lactoylglutathione lyase family enzyme
MLKIKDARATLPAQDLARARKFYEGKLGLKAVEDSPDGGAVYEAGATRFLVFPSRGKASGDHTQMGFQVEDITLAVRDLKDKGVVFEEYNFPDFKTVDGILTMGDDKTAWFKDTEGNLLGLVQRVAVTA